MGIARKRAVSFQSLAAKGDIWWTPRHGRYAARVQSANDYPQA
jgi:hypothetical protein